MIASDLILLTFFRVGTVKENLIYGRSIWVNLRLFIDGPTFRDPVTWTWKLILVQLVELGLKA